METKNKVLSQEEIISKFMDYSLSHGAKPKSVYEFAKHEGFLESEFYEFFGNLESIDKVIFKQFLDNTLSLLEKNEAYSNYDERAKLLSFYFTFFEILTANRSYVIMALTAHKNQLKNLTQLSRLRTAFKHYIATIITQQEILKGTSIKEFQEKAMMESAWVQLLITMKFWLDDSSAKFEKTDIFIEKSINTTFDLMNTKPLESLLDFGKFIFNERIFQKS